MRSNRQEFLRSRAETPSGCGSPDHSWFVRSPVVRPPVVRLCDRDVRSTLRQPAFIASKLAPTISRDQGCSRYCASSDCGSELARDRPRRVLQHSVPTMPVPTTLCLRHCACVCLRLWQLESISARLFSRAVLARGTWQRKLHIPVQFGLCRWPVQFGLSSLACAVWPVQFGPCSFRSCAVSRVPGYEL